MSYEVERFEHAGHTIVIRQEEDARFADPRGDAQLGTMVCWHPSYILGDEQIAGDSDRGTRGALYRDHNGSASKIFQTEDGRDDFRSMEVIERYLRFARGAVVVLPLYLLDHSGIYMSAGSNTVGRGDTASGGRDSWGNPNGWDTTMCGFIYTTSERIAELCGEPQLETDPYYCPRTWPDAPQNWDGTAEAWIVQQLDNEVREYSAWLEGSVYWWAVYNSEDEIMESCGGYIAADEEAMEYVRGEAREAAEAEAHDESINTEPDVEAVVYAASR